MKVLESIFWFDDEKTSLMDTVMKYKLTGNIFEIMYSLYLIQS